MSDTALQKPRTLGDRIRQAGWTIEAIDWPWMCKRCLGCYNTGTEAAKKGDVVACLRCVIRALDRAAQPAPPTRWQRFVREFKPRSLLLMRNALYLVVGLCAFPFWVVYVVLVWASIPFMFIGIAAHDGGKWLLGAQARA